MLDKIAIIGYSGHGFVVADSAFSAGLNLGYYCEKDELVANPFKLKYLGFEGNDGFIGWKENFRFILGIGDNKIRQKIGLKILENNCEVLTVIDPTACLSSYLEIGKGNFIAKQVTVNALASIGDFCILNTGCIVEHECKIGNGVHLAPGSVLAGNVSVGPRSFIGANSVIMQGVTIGSNVIIGAGSVIIKNIEDNKTVVGNPGRII